jgi:hypothetical protein
MVMSPWLQRSRRVVLHMHMYQGFVNYRGARYRHGGNRFPWFPGFLPVCMGEHNAIAGTGSDVILLKSTRSSIMNFLMKT